MRFALFLTGFVLLAGAGYAQVAPETTLPPLTVTEHPSGADERTAAIWVEARDPALAPPAHARDLLTTIPGLYLNQPGGPGGRSSLWIRGAEDNYTIVYLDNIPLNDPTTSTGGAVDFSLIDPAFIQSAAVVRGPSSVRYGAEALAGVVHLGTEAPQETWHQLAVEGGDVDQRRAALIVQQPLDARTTLALDAATADAGSLDLGSRSRRRAFRAAVTVHGAVTLKLAAWHLSNDAETFPDDSGGREFAVIRTLEHRRQRDSAGSLQLDSDYAQQHWSLVIDGAQFTAAVNSPGVAPGLRDPQGLPASTDDTRLRRLRIKAMVEHAARDWHYSGGVDFERETGRDDGTLDFGGFVLPTSFSIGRSHAGIFAETTGPVLPAVNLALGARVDHYSNELTRGTIRAGVLGRFSEVNDWRINVGNAFKPPSFFALANPLVGNPELRPERGVSFDAGVRRRIDHGRGMLDFSLFASRYRDATDFDPGPPPRIVNRNEINCRGAEGAVAWRLSDTWQVGGSLSYVDARRDAGNVRMRARPHWRAGLTTSYVVTGTVTLSAALLAIDQVPDSSIPTGDVMLAGWARFDIGLVWRLREGLEATFALQNALAASYTEAVGFPALGRTWRAGLRTNF